MAFCDWFGRLCVGRMMIKREVFVFDGGDVVVCKGVGGVLLSV